MRVLLRLSPLKPREAVLINAWTAGIVAAGDQIVTHQPDVEIIHGIAKLHHATRAPRYIYTDKSYSRDPSRIRVSVGSHNPQIWPGDYPRDRLTWSPAPWRGGDHVLLAGSSAKFHTAHNLCPPTDFARKVVRGIRLVTDRPIVYRPKQSWRDARPIDGTVFSHKGRPIAADLEGAHCLVTYGSNAAFEAIMAGVPAVILGTAVTRPVSSTRIDDVAAPRLAPRDKVLDLLAGLAYHDWHIDELRDGTAWAFLKSRL